MGKKVFILFPDGVGLRNFAFTGFKEIGDKLDFDITYWNNTVFPIKETLGFQELKIQSTRIHPKTPVLSHARKRVELALSRKRTNDPVYNTYRFPLKWNSIKHFLKSTFVTYHERFSATQKGWRQLMNQMYAAERSTSRYQEVRKQLIEHQPNLVFCTTQRATQAIAPILAAQDLGIKTACWIYSWDNLPKGMSTIETDYYFVWSELMKRQLLEYYPKTKPDQIFVTGTPQFEPHYDTDILLSRKQFCEEHGLNVGTRYICFSGDDQTTSPLDQYYLEDTAVAVRRLKEEGLDIGIIYRQVPVDFTGRYDEVLKYYKDVITPIAPLWQPMGKGWNEVMPTKADFTRLVNTCYHSELVVNICSSMVFDFVIHDKPTIYPNYEQPQLRRGIRDIGQNYEYVHFRSMPDREKSVIWAYDKSEIYKGIKGLLDGELNPVPITRQWYGIVNKPESPEKASERIWQEINKILN